MALIKNYQTDETLTGNELILSTDVSDQNKTKNIKIDKIKEYILSFVQNTNNTDKEISNYCHTANFTFCLNNNIKDLNLIILSDSTGDQVGEWAYLLAEFLAETYPSYTVNFRHWDIVDLIYQPIDIIQTGNISSPKSLNIYLGGASGQGLAYANENFDNLFPTVPDLVMISYGHNDNYANSQLYITEYLKLTKNIKTNFVDSQIILIGQNPKSSDQLTYDNGIKNVYDIQKISGQEGFGFINIMQRFIDYGNYSTDLLTDGIHPNTEGSILWAASVIEVFSKKNYNKTTNPIHKVESIFVSANNLNSESPLLTFISKPGDVKIPTLELLPDIVNGVHGTTILPYEWKTINVYVYWTTDTNSSSSNVYFNSYLYFLNEGQSPNLDSNGAFRFVNGSSEGTINKTQIFSYLGSGEHEVLFPGKPFVFSITRLGNNANDTYTGNCRVLGILFERRT